MLVLSLSLNELPGLLEDQSTVSGLHGDWAGIVPTVEAAETLGSLEIKPYPPPASIICNQGMSGMVRQSSESIQEPASGNL